MITDGLNPFTALAFIALVLGGGALVAISVFARLTARRTLARWAFRLGAAGSGAYLLLYLLASATSRDRVLAPGEEKHICEVDCHLAYSVAGVRTESLEGGRVRHVVTVKVRFDEETISAGRPRDMPLSPNSRFVALVDADGRRYPGATDGLRRRLIPGESYTVDLVFDVPANARDLWLVLRSNDVPTPFLIGHENSVFHGRTTFALRRGT